MLVKVIYKNDLVGGFTGRAYTYKTELPLNEGDIVLAPVANEDELKRALVVETDVPETEIDPSWADRVKSITQYDAPQLRQNVVNER